MNNAHIGTPGDARPDPFPEWYNALEQRHSTDLTFQEIRRSVQALSRGYVEKRASGLDRALGSAGKRAAFALFYGPLHFLTIREIVRRLRPGPVRQIIDLGCGTGVAGAAWALEHTEPSEVEGIERHPWAVAEARWALRRLGLRARVREMDLERYRPGNASAGIVAAFTLNELEETGRDRITEHLLEKAVNGSSVLIVEPIARRLTPWWNAWTDRIVDAGGRSDEWRIASPLPESLRLMDRAAHLDHRELTARSLWLGPAHGPAVR